MLSARSAWVIPSLGKSACSSAFALSVSLCGHSSTTLEVRSFLRSLTRWACAERPLLVGGGQRDTRMHRTYDPALRFSIDPVREFGQCFINPPPEGDTVCNRGRFGNRAEVGDELVEDLTVDAARLHQKLHCSPVAVWRKRAIMAIVA
jgi:hypothetical protein